MKGKILLKLVSVLTPDDVYQLKFAGCGDEINGFLIALNKLAIAWRSELSPEVWAEAQTRLQELWAWYEQPIAVM